MNRSRMFFAATITVCVLALAAVLLSAGQAITNVNNGTLKLTLVPADASIKADGKAAKLSDKGELSLNPGSHTLTFTRGGFTSKTLTVNITARQTASRTVTLAIATPAGLDYLKKHPDEAALLDKLGTEQMEQHAKAITENAPLIQLLPYHGANFDIDVGRSKKYTDDAHAAAVYITADTAQAQAAALGWIRAQGYDPAGYEIIYQTYASAR